MDKKEYIERGTLIDILDAKSEMAMGTPKAVFASVSKMVELLPADDVVEVVRCKDCKHWTPMDDGISWNNRGRADGRCKMLENMHYSERGLTNEGHFCSYGERKDRHDHFGIS